MVRLGTAQCRAPFAKNEAEPPQLRPDTGAKPKMDPNPSASQNSKDNPATEPDNAPLSFWQMLASTLWAALGVQNKKNRQRDFTRGKASHFIFFGIGFTLCFVLAVYAIVSLVLGGAA